jgi:hypothetical protein
LFVSVVVTIATPQVVAVSFAPAVTAHHVFTFARPETIIDPVTGVVVPFQSSFNIKGTEVAAVARFTTLSSVVSRFTK